MKAITLTQPWATLVALGAKRIETRSWQTSYRGPLAIHAAKGFPGWAREICETDPFVIHLMRGLGFDFNDCGWKALPTGCILAVCDLVNIYSTNSRVFSFAANAISFNAEEGFDADQVSSFQMPPPEPELSFGDYSPGRFAWQLDNIRALPEPIPVKGALSLWEWDEREWDEPEVAQG